MTDLNGQPPDAEVAQVLERSAALCAQLGHRVEHASLPLGAGEVPDTFMTIWAYLARELVEHSRADQVEPWTVGLARWSEQLQTEQLESFHERVVTIPQRLSEFFRSHDVILSPVLPRPSVAVGELAPTRPFDEVLRVFVDYVSYTPLHNIAGLP